MDRDKCPGCSRAKDVSGASISVCCPVRPEQQLASSTSVEEGTRSGAQEQEHLFQLNGKFNELQENESEEEDARVNQPLVSEPCTKRPFCHSVRGAPSVRPGGATTRRTAEFPKTHTQSQKS